MASTQNHTSSEDMSYGGQTFEPFEFDESVDPDLPDGVTYELTINDVKVRLSNADASGHQYPQMILEWKALSTEDESKEAQRGVGQTTSEFITLRPKGDRKGNLSKQRLTLLRNRFGIDSDVVPTQMRSLDDLQPLADALKGQTLTAPVKSAKDKTGAWRTNIIIKMEGGVDVEAEETEEPPKPKAAKATTKSAAKANGGKKAAARR